jgi:sulfite exporter TauE/SafE
MALPFHLTALLPVFVTGLAGSVHCAGMCGGIVSALTAAQPAPPHPAPGAAQARVIPITVVLAPGQALRVAAYNAGRIGSYVALGTTVGGFAASLADITQLAQLQTVFYWMANLMLVALGLHLMKAWRGLLVLEAKGRVLWGFVSPLLKPLVPMDTLPKAFAAGAMWGFLPCGMIYSLLLTALLSGSAMGGAAVMFAFGLGTLPMLFGLGMLGARLRAAGNWAAFRRAGGMLVLGFGLLGLFRAATGITSTWMDALCLTTH